MTQPEAITRAQALCLVDLYLLRAARQLAAYPDVLERDDYCMDDLVHHVWLARKRIREELKAMRTAWPDLPDFTIREGIQ